MQTHASDYYIIKKKRSPLRVIIESVALVLFWQYIIVDFLIIISVLFNIRMPLIDGVIYYLSIDRGDARRLMYFTFFIISISLIFALLILIQRFIQRLFDKRHDMNIKY